MPPRAPRAPSLRAVAAAAAALLLGAAPGIPRAGDPEPPPADRFVVGPWSGLRYTVENKSVSDTNLFFVAPDGRRFASVQAIVEAEALALDPVRRALHRSLWKHLEPGADPDAPVEVAVVLRSQPLHAAGAAARERHAPLLRAHQARARAVLARIEPLLPSPAARRAMDIHALSAAERALLDDADLEELRASRAGVAETLALLRREVLAESRAAADLDQAPLLRWLEATPGARLLDRSRTLGAVFASVPAGSLAALLDAVPGIARVGPIGRATVTMDTSTATIGAPDGWSAGYDGSSATKVAVVDTGVDATHPALSPVVSDAGVFLNLAKLQSDFNDSATSTDDRHGHGTHVAGTVASNDATYKGVAPGGRVMGAKCLYLTTGGGGSGLDPDIFAAMDWATDNGAAVLNLSLGGDTSDNDGDSDIARFCDAVVFALVVPVAVASGNSGSGAGTVGTPGDAFNVVTVGAFDDWDTASHSDNVLASFSSRGPTKDGRRKPDIAAPGSYIASCSASWEGGGADFVVNHGTSMACPHVAGALAILVDANASWTPEGMKALLAATTRNASPYGTSPGEAWGHGGLDVARAYAHRASVHEGTLTSSGAAYRLLRPGSLASGGRVTLAWNRHVASNDASAPSSYHPLLDLDVFVYDEATGSEAARGDDAVDSLEFAKVASAVAAPIVKVERAGSFPSGVSTEWFAVAAESTAATVELDPPALACSFTTLPALSPGTTQFTVTAKVANSGEARAFAPKATLTLPSGYSLVSGANPATPSSIAAGADASASWTVRSRTTTGSGNFSVAATSTSYGESFASAAATQSHATDAGAPTGSLSLDGGAAATGDLEVALAIAASDDLSGVVEMRIRDAGDAWGAWIPYQASSTWTLPSGEALRTVEAQVRDAAGNESAVLSDAIYHDLTPPSGSVSVAGGADYSNLPTAVLALAASDAGSGVAEMSLRLAGGSWGPWIPFAESHEFVLGASEGTKTVEARFRDGAGNESDAAADTVVLDLTPPTGTVSVEDDAFFTESASVTLSVGGDDSLSGMDAMRFRNADDGGAAWSAWQPFAATHPWTLSAGQGARSVAAEVRDRAGNVASASPDGILLDSTPPVGTVALAGGAAAVAGTAVTLDLAWSDEGSSVDAVRLRDQGGAWSDWAAPAPSVPWTLPAGDGAKQVEAQFRDLCGHLSEVASAGTLLDTVPPAGSFTLGAAPAYRMPWEPLLAHLDADDGPAGSGVDAFRWSTDGGATWSAWTPLDGGPVPLPRPAAAHALAVLGELRDLAGNEAPAGGASIYLVPGEVQGLVGVAAVAGSLDADGDHDAFSLELAAGDLLDLALKAKASRRGAAFAPAIDLFAPDGTRVVEGSFPAGAAKAGVKRFPAPATGRYFVVLRPGGADAAEGGTYTLKPKVRMAKARKRLSGTSVPSGEPPVAVVPFDAAEGDRVSAVLVVPTLDGATLAGPDGFQDAPLASKGGKHTLAATTLARGSGPHELRVGTSGALEWRLVLKPPLRAAGLLPEVE